MKKPRARRLPTEPGIKYVKTIRTTFFPSTRPEDITIQVTPNE